MQAFDQINAAYDGRTRWVLLSPRDSDIGLDSSHFCGPATQTSPERPVLVRLKLLQGNDVVSDADLLIVPGNEATLFVSTTGGKSLEYHVVTSASSPSYVELRAQLRAAPDGREGEVVAALAKHLQLSPDRATSAGRLVTPSGDYDLAVLYATPL